MCDKREAILKKHAARHQRPVQQVIPEPAVPLQPPGGAPHLFRMRPMHRNVSRNQNLLNNNLKQLTVQTMFILIVEETGK